MGIIMKNGVCYSNGGNTTIQPVIYSDTEREVGVWRDGKPLYQKTIHISSLPQTAYDTYQIASNIDKVVDYKGIVFYSTGTAVVIFQTRPDNTNSQFYHDIEDDKTFFFRTYRSEQGEAYVTFQYTKATDTPGSGTWTPSGAPAVHYSTDEQIIGTWIDGRSIYQRVFTGLNVSTQGTSWTTLSTIDSSSWTEVIDASIYRTGLSGVMLRMPIAESGISDDGNHPMVTVVSSDFNGTITTAIFTYVKSS